jgi:hypothetical protein
VLVPAGDDALLAGERGWVVAPKLTLHAELGEFGALAELGARLRKATELGGFRVGHQLSAALGAYYAVVPNDALVLTAEAMALPVVTAQPRRDYDDGSRAVDARLVPAQWWAGLATRLAADTWLRVGAGGGLPLSFETLRDADGSERTEHFAGITTPSFHGFAAISVATPAPDSS